MNDLKLKQGSHALDAQAKGKAAQSIVAKLLESAGFLLVEVKKVSANGIDIVAIKHDQYYLIEVKTAIETARTYVVRKIHEKADFVFLVLPSGHLFIEDAASWRKLVDKAGNRRVTKIVSLYQNLPSSTQSAAALARLIEVAR